MNDYERMCELIVNDIKLAIKSTENITHPSNAHEYVEKLIDYCKKLEEFKWKYEDLCK